MEVCLEVCFKFKTVGALGPGCLHRPFPGSRVRSVVLEPPCPQPFLWVLSKGSETRKWGGSVGILQGLTFGRKCCPHRDAEQNVELRHLSPRYNYTQ